MSQIFRKSFFFHYILLCHRLLLDDDYLTLLLFLDFFKANQTFINILLMVKKSHQIKSWDFQNREREKKDREGSECMCVTLII